MKAILVVDLPDDYEEYEKWYIEGDDLKIVYEEDGALHTYKYIDVDLVELKPMPQKKTKDIDFVIRFGYNQCIDEILGEQE